MKTLEQLNRDEKNCLANDVWLLAYGNDEDFEEKIEELGGWETQDDEEDGYEFPDGSFLILGEFSTPQVVPPGWTLKSVFDVCNG